MKTIHSAAALAALAFGAVSANAISLFSTGFEAAQGYTNNTQLATNANWSGSGQDTSGWLVTNSTVGGSGASAGSQWVLTSGANATTTKFQWTNTPVTDFSVNNIIQGSTDVKLVSPASGSTTRTTFAGIQMYDAAVNLLGQMYLIIDSENLLGAGAGHMFVELDFADNTGHAYDLGVANALNQYVNLSLAADFTAGTLTGYFNGSALPDVGSLNGATDFHDFDLFLGSTSTSGGTRARGGFDNYSISAVPAPASLALLGLGGLVAGRRRR